MDFVLCEMKPTSAIPAATAAHRGRITVDNVKLGRYPVLAEGMNNQQ